MDITLFCHFPASWKLRLQWFHASSALTGSCVFFQPPPPVARLHPGAAQPSALQLLRPCPTVHDPLQPADHRQHHTQAAPQIAHTKTTHTYMCHTKTRSAHTHTEMHGLTNTVQALLEPLYMLYNDKLKDSYLYCNKQVIKPERL